MYSESGDVPLPDILEKIYEVKGGESIDIKGFGSDEAMREFFATILPDFDREKVYNTDIRKLFTWYNQLVAAEDQAAEAAEAADEAATEK